MSKAQLEPKAADWDIRWVAREGGRAPRVAADPQWPKGKELKTYYAEFPSCRGELPYVMWPERGLGMLMVTCRKCGVVTAVTTAGRPDDPISLTQNCKDA